MSEPVWLKVLVECCAILGAVIGTVTAILAVSTFRKNAKLKRAEWLKALYTQFYESTKYSDIRRILDYRPKAEFDRLKEAVQSNDGATEEFVIYLNFFEFVASLWKLDQLSLREVKMLFEYYVRLLDHEELQFVGEYVAKWGFENLGDLMAAVREEGTRS